MKIHIFILAVLSALGMGFGLYNNLVQPTNSEIDTSKYEVSFGLLYQVDPVDTAKNYKLCGIDMPDSEIILVSQNLGNCGQSITVRFVQDDSVVSAQIAGILLDSSDKVQVYRLSQPELAEIVVH